MSQGPFLRKYGVQNTINFDLFEVDGVDFRTNAADGGTNCSIMKDEGAEATCTNDFVDEGTTYSLVLTATEMQAARIKVLVIDTGTKVWLDTSVVIETYGHASAQHAFDLSVATVDVGKWLGTAVNVDTNGYPKVTIKAGTGTGELTLASGNVSVNVLKTAAIEDLFSVDSGTTAVAAVDGSLVAEIINNVDLSALGAASGGALNFANEADNVDAPIKSITFDGVETGGTNASVNSEDGVYHVIDDTGGDIDIVYQFDVGGGRTGVEVTWKGYLSGPNNEATIQVYNGSTWDTITTFNGKALTSNDTVVAPLLSTHTGTGSDLGKVFIRIECVAQSNPTLNTDSLLVSGVNVGQSVGYDGGRIWVNTNVDNTSTEAFVDGVADKPVSTWTAALTLSLALNIKRFYLIDGSAIELSDDSDAFDIKGVGYSLVLGGQLIEGAVIEGATITGVGTATVTKPHFFNCEFGATTIPPCEITRSGFGHDGGTLTAGSAGEYVFHQCYSDVAGSGVPFFAFSGNGASSEISNRGWTGGASWTIDSDCTLSHEVLAGGGTSVVTGGGDAEVRGICRSLSITLSASETVQFVGITGPITISGSAVAATVNLHGVSDGVITDTSSGVVITDNTISKHSVTDAVWDEDITEHSIVRSFGKKLVDILKLKRIVP